MYKIYINENLLLLTDGEHVREVKLHRDNHWYLTFTGKKKFLKWCIKRLEKNQVKQITVYCSNLEFAFRTFTSMVRPIEAAGGLVRNQKNEFLFIFRRGNWDLPKGKLDFGEQYEQAAVREVKEETGIDANIVNPLITTYHTYRFKDKPALKVSIWYLMDATTFELRLQKEEDIKKATWVTLKKAKKSLKPIYPNILAVVNAELKKHQTVN